LATSDRAQVPGDWPASRYEQKCITGNPPMFFLYRRHPRP
ncbi:MAG: tRNA (guanosine(46)-N7)-methyltransferase TrmB, partial [Magnetospirillum sp.]|nr:tRNA (guanosine(46)-N7)-methyltransferase TrmB [Magnetospirillum sp.]